MAPQVLDRTDPADAPPAEGACCSNCGAALVGPFCARCGQRAEPIRQPVQRIVADAFVEMFGVDGRFWRTAAYLLFRPGRLTTEYRAGKRQRYVRPFRVYLVASLSFFFLITLLDPVSRVDPMQTAPVPTEPRTAEQRLREIDAELERLSSQRERAEAQDARDFEARLDHLGEELRAEREALAEAPPESMVVPAASDLVYNVTLLYGPPMINVGLPEWLPKSPAVQRASDARTQREAQQALAELLRSTIARFATMMFILLPLFAFLLKLAYVRRDWYYSEHLVFALHVHAFAFVVMAVVLTVALLVSGNWAGIATNGLVLAIPIYFLIAQRVVYGQSVLKSLLKALVVGGVYFFVLTVGVLASLLVAAALG